MTEKEFLETYMVAQRKVDALRAEYEAQRLAADSIRSALDGDGGRTTEISRPVERAAVKLAEKAEALRAAEVEALRARVDVEIVVNAVPDVMGAVLWERFVNLKPWGAVAKAVGYSKRQTFRYYEAGLVFVRRLLALEK